MIRQKQIDINGMTLSVSAVGDGDKTIVFLHGASMSSDTWMPQLLNKELNSRYQLIAIDLPGHGKSGRLGRTEAYQISLLAETIGQLPQALGLKEFLLLGLSYSTSIIGEILSPLSNCRGIMLVSPFILGKKLSPADILTPGQYAFVAVTENPGEQELREFIKAGTGSAEIGERFYHTYQNTDPTFRPSIAQFFSGAYTDQLTNIQRWKVPVCVVFGKQENSVRTDYLNDYPALWKGKVHHIENSVHLPNEENPKVFNRLLTEFANDIFK